jgi:hypothetical protein
MKKILLLATVALLSLSSCNNDDDKTTSPTPLEHIWSLVSVSGGFTGSTATFEDTEILWRFNANGTVNINNKNTDTSKEDYFDSGDYDYVVSDNEPGGDDCKKTMKVDNIDFMCYRIDTTGRLILDSAPADGHTLIFIRADATE